MRIDEATVRRMMPNAGPRLDPHIPHIITAMEAGRIDTPRRIAAFLAQVAHESGEYRYLEELASGDAYDTRTDLGNTPAIDGDGRKYKGRGPMQITGTANYRACGLALGVDLLDDPSDASDDEDPDKLKLPQYATASAVWFWNRHQLSKLADVDWFKTITRIINGGYNGLSDRRNYWDRNRALLGLPYVDLDRETTAIKEFQRSHGLTPDGVVGPLTTAML
jgi:putative chitinase